jgi:hypothetical protein
MVGGANLVLAKESVQFLKTALEHADVFGIRGLELPQIVLVDMRDSAGLNRLEKFHQPVSLLMPILRAHDTSILPTTCHMMARSQDRSAGAALA